MAQFVKVVRKNNNDAGPHPTIEEINMITFLISWFVLSISIMLITIVCRAFNAKIDRLFNDKYKDW